MTKVCAESVGLLKVLKLEKKYGLHSLLELNEHWKLKKDTKLSDLHFNMQSVIKTQFIGKHFVSTVTKLHLWESQLS